MLLDDGFVTFIPSTASAWRPEGRSGATRLHPTWRSHHERRQGDDRKRWSVLHNRRNASFTGGRSCGVPGPRWRVQDRWRLRRLDRQRKARCRRGSQSAAVWLWADLDGPEFVRCRESVITRNQPWGSSRICSVVRLHTWRWDLRRADPVRVQKREGPRSNALHANDGEWPNLLWTYRRRWKHRASCDPRAHSRRRGDIPSVRAHAALLRQEGSDWCPDRSDKGRAYEFGSRRLLELNGNS